MVVVTAIKPPIHANRGPIKVAKEPTTPLLAPRPMANSAIINGRDQMKRKIIQGIRNAAPPFSAAIRGNLHKFPVPTAKPRPARINPHLEENLSPRAKLVPPCRSKWPLRRTLYQECLNDGSLSVFTLTKKLLENTSIVNLTKAPHYLVSDDLRVWLLK